MITGDSVEKPSLFELFELKVLETNCWLYLWLSILLYAIGLGFFEEILNTGKPLYQVVDFLGGACWQLGLAGAVITVFAIFVRFLSLNKFRSLEDVLNVAFLKGILIFFITLALCEVLLRIVFYNGMTFSFTPGGPISARFKSKLTLNRFGSRGPDGGEYPVGGETRIVVVGDSITFGQGIRNEKDLYTSKLLKLLNDEGDNRFNMFVIATPGHDNDDHVKKLDRYGLEIKPDVVVYQWFINDLEPEESKQKRQHLGLAI